jgi:hypothetical protein
MTPVASIFLDINLPNPTTWFYFSGLLAVALFFKFSRLLSVRNLDVLTLYLFMPGLLLLAEGGRYQLTDRALASLRSDGVPEAVLSRLTPLKGWVLGREAFLSELAGSLSGDEQERYQKLVLNETAESGDHTFWGYLWLMIASLYFLIRCLLDLALVRRPALAPNLDFDGLVWLAGALFLSMIAVIVQQDHRPNKAPEAAGNPIEKMPGPITVAVRPYAPPELAGSLLRVWVERILALLCHLSVAIGLALIGWRHFDDIRAGMAAATFYLLLPYTFLLLPDSPLGVGRWDHAWPMALVVWAIFSYRRPILAGAFLGLAAGTAFFLVVTLPAWASFYYRRGMARFLVSFVLFAGLGLGVLGVVLWINGELPSSLQSDWTKFVWQPWKQPATPGFWKYLPSETVARMPAAYRVPVFVVSMALVVTSAFWPGPKNLAHVLALSAATLISIQFWYADRGGVYVLWYLPLLLLLVFRPNLASRQPPVPPADDWPARLGRQLSRLTFRLLRRPLPSEHQAA